MSWYLVGPIQWAKDFMSWRIEIEDFLEELGHSARMPWGEIHSGKEGKVLFSDWVKVMNPGDYYSRVRKYMRRYVIKYDLKQVVKGDGIIFYIPKDTPTVGSYGEQTLKYYLLNYRKKTENKKIFVITDVPFSEQSYWMIGCSDMIFHSFEEFKQYFREHYDLKKKGTGKEIDKKS